MTFVPFTEWADRASRSGRCGFRYVFNPIAVRFRYRHHECVLKPDHPGLHRCSCRVEFDELGIVRDLDALEGHDGSTWLSLPTGLLDPIMGVSDWNFREPVDLQDYPWDCAACSTAWALRACGHTYTEQDVIAGLGPSRISPTYGLLDASGAGLVQWLGEIGVAADNNADASWTDLVDAAGYQPMVIGGRSWCHWVGVRMGGPAAGLGDVGALALMNSAPGWMHVDQILYDVDLERLGPFSAVWFTSW